MNYILDPTFFPALRGKSKILIQVHPLKLPYFLDIFKSGLCYVGKYIMRLIAVGRYISSHFQEKE